VTFQLLKKEKRKRCNPVNGCKQDFGNNHVMMSSGALSSIK
jgi:hypothetical protein